MMSHSDCKLFVEQQFPEATECWIKLITDVIYGNPAHIKESLLRQSDPRDLRDLLGVYGQILDKPNADVWKALDHSSDVWVLCLPVETLKTKRSC
jgi:hypothetical protein